MSGITHSDLEKSFPITSLCRQDLVEAGIPQETVARLDDTAMRAIAAAMEDTYIATKFEESLTYQVERDLKQHGGQQASDTTEEMQVEDNLYSESFRLLLKQVEDLPDVLGDTEGIMVDDQAMTLLYTSVEGIATQIRALQQEILDPTTELTKYLVKRIAADTEAMRQAQSVICERGYEEQAASRLHEWVHAHMSAILSPLLCRNPYQTDWLDWMQQIIRVGLNQVDWTELINRLQEAESASRERQE